MTQFTTDTAPVHIADLSGGDAATRVAARSLLADLVELVKPRITLMVLITAYIGYVLGAPGTPGTSLLGVHGVLAMLMALAGIGLCCMGSAVYNQVYERETDARMVRTRNRPLPAGRIGPVFATVYAIVLSLVGIALLAAFANLLTAGLAAFTIASYVLVYTPLKRVTHLSTIIGAVPGAMPPVLGAAAVSGELNTAALVLFGILFMWQVPHFLAIGWLFREDYARADMPMLSVLDPTGQATFRQSLFGCMALLPLGLLPTAFDMTGTIYFVGALLAGAAFLATAIMLLRERTTDAARRMFRASLLYLPLVVLLMLIDRV